MKKTISYTVNPYLELFGVISIIADESDTYKKAGDELYNKNYRDEILDHFGLLNKHKAVELLTYYSKAYQFNYDAPCVFFLEMGDNKNFSDYISKERLVISQKELDRLVKEINNFINESNFKQFYEANKYRYRKSIEVFKNKTKAYSPEKYLYSLIGEKPREFTINLMHGVTNSNYGLSTDKSHYVCIAANGPSDVEGEANFASNLSNIMSLILHELAHAFINPLTRKYETRIKDANPKIFQDIFINNPYGSNIETAINETIIRSMECLYIRDYFPNEFDQFFNSYLLKGFIKIPKLMDFFEHMKKEEFGKRRLNDYYPKLLNTLLE